MNAEMETAIVGKVASLHLHPKVSGGPMVSVDAIELVEGKGILGEPRFFARVSRFGKASRRQVTLIEREQISEHAATLGLISIPPGAVRANIETLGIDLAQSSGGKFLIGGAILLLYARRDPCAKMDLLCPGLKDLMSNGRQGMLAQVVQSGVVRLGDSITKYQPNS